MIAELPPWAVRLRAERRDRLWSQKEMARHLVEAADGATRNGLPARETIVRRIKAYEAGHNEPRDPYRMLYARAFGTTESDLFGPSLPVLQQDDPASGFERLRLSLDEVTSAGAMSEAALEHWETTVLLHGEAVRSRPAEVLVQDLAADFNDLRQVLERHRSASALRRLTRVVAQMSGLMCLTFIKLDNRTAFRGWAPTARVAATEAGDATTLSWVLAQESYGHYYAGDHVEAIRVAQGAQNVAPSCAGAVLGAALEARAHAALSPSRVPETRAALARARRLLDELSPSEENASAFGYNEAQFRFHEGNAFTHLGDTAAAWAAQQSALRLCPEEDYMERTLTRLDRTLCLVRDGDVPSALEYATVTLTPLVNGLPIVTPSGSGNFNPPGLAQSRLARFSLASSSRRWRVR
ncbi:helix-turn-helix transcriptional regulator [Microbispora amethystogenes]|uniref:helix-turn-helix transcriptional regulator n=1 Tax=Microbispora amethystogenes TaxID=1427754 RepID=UPI0031EDA67D